MRQPLAEMKMASQSNGKSTRSTTGQPQVQQRSMIENLSSESNRMKPEHVVSTTGKTWRDDNTITTVEYVTTDGSSQDLISWKSDSESVSWHTNNECCDTFDNESIAGFDLDDAIENYLAKFTPPEGVQINELMKLNFYVRKSMELANGGEPSIEELGQILQVGRQEGIPAEVITQIFSETYEKILDEAGVGYLKGECQERGVESFDETDETLPSCTEYNVDLAGNIENTISDNSAIEQYLAKFSAPEGATQEEIDQINSHLSKVMKLMEDFKKPTMDDMGDILRTGRREGIPTNIMTEVFKETIEHEGVKVGAVAPLVKCHHKSFSLGDDVFLNIQKNTSTMKSFDDTEDISSFLARFARLKAGGHFPDADIDEIIEKVASNSSAEDAIEIDAVYGFVKKELNVEAEEENSVHVKRALRKAEQLNPIIYELGKSIREKQRQLKMRNSTGDTRNAVEYLSVVNEDASESYSMITENMSNIESSKNELLDLLLDFVESHFHMCMPSEDDGHSRNMYLTSFGSSIATTRSEFDSSIATTRSESFDHSTSTYTKYTKEERMSFFSLLKTLLPAQERKELSAVGAAEKLRSRGFTQGGKILPKLGASNIRRGYLDRNNENFDINSFQHTITVSNELDSLNSTSWEKHDFKPYFENKKTGGVPYWFGDPSYESTGRKLSTVPDTEANKLPMVIHRAEEPRPCVPDHMYPTETCDLPIEPRRSYMLELSQRKAPNYRLETIGLDAIEIERPISHDNNERCIFSQNQSIRSMSPLTMDDGDNTFRKLSKSKYSNKLPSGSVCDNSEGPETMSTMSSITGTTTVKEKKRRLKKMFARTFEKRGHKKSLSSVTQESNSSQSSKHGKYR